MSKKLRPFGEAVIIMVAASLVGIAWNAVSSTGIPLKTVVSTVPDDEIGSAVEEYAEPVLGEPLNIDLAEMRAAVEQGGVLILDARDVEDFAEAHIPGSQNLPPDEFAQYYDFVLGGVDKDERIICYCYSSECDLGHDLAYQLQLQGHSNVSVYVGGWEEWEENGHEAAAGGM